jgi:hypothetical protein
MNSNRNQLSRLVFGGALIALALTAAFQFPRSHAQTILALQLTPTLSVTGAIGSWQQIQYSDELADPTNWTMLTNLLLTQNPLIFTDLSGNRPRAILSFDHAHQRPEHKPGLDSARNVPDGKPDQ